MGQAKGCINKSCKAYHKTVYKSKDEYCLLCGQPLVPICKHRGCFKQLPLGDKSKYCAYHEAEREERKEKAIDGAKKVGGGLVAGVGIVFTVGKTILDKAKK